MNKMHKQKNKKGISIHFFKPKLKPNIFPLIWVPGLPQEKVPV